MPYFHSAEDKERTTKVWNLASNNGYKHIAYLQTPIDTIELEAMEGKAVYCPDAVSPINVYAIPPLAYDSNWKWYEILSANKIISRKLYPGVTYYLVREKNFAKKGEGEKVVESAEFLTESAMLQNGWAIIENEYFCDLKLQFEENEISTEVDLRGNSVYLIDKAKSGGDINRYVRIVSSSTEPNLPITIKNGKKFLVKYLNEDALYKSSPVLVVPKEKLIDEKRNKGSLLLSHVGKRRMHVWQDGNFPLNTLSKEGCKDFCQDQFWSFDPVEGPEFPGEMNEPDEKVFTITSKKSKKRLYAKLQESGTSLDDFGLISNGVNVDDSQKWQILEGYLVDDVESDGSNKYYYIVNAHSDRFLGLQDDGDSKMKLNRVIAASADEALLDGDSMKKFQWHVAPWAILVKHITSKKQNEEQNEDLIKLPQDINASVPDKKFILKRNSLPAKTFLEDGGIIISNPYPNLYTVKWSGEKRGFNLMPNSKVFLPPPKNVNEETKEASITINSSNDLHLKVGVEYVLYYDENDPLCLGTPTIVSLGKIEEAKSKREGFYLIYKDKDGKILRLGGISKRGFIRMGPHNDKLSYRDQLWSLEPTSKSKQFKIASSQKFMSSDHARGVKALPVNDAMNYLWTIDAISSENSKLIKCTIENSIGGDLQYLDDCQKCHLTPGKSEGSFWAIIKKNDINSDEVKKYLYGTAQDVKSIEFQEDTLQNPNVPILPGMIWYPNSLRWRLLGKDFKTNMWDVKSITFFDPFEQAIEVDPDNAFASRSYNNSNWGPKNPFDPNTSSSWGGRSDSNKQFYIGMKFEKAVRVGFGTYHINAINIVMF